MCSLKQIQQSHSAARTAGKPPVEPWLALITTRVACAASAEERRSHMVGKDMRSCRHSDHANIKDAQELPSPRSGKSVFS